MTEDYIQTIALLKVIGEEMENMAKDAKTVLDRLTEVRERTEEVERLVDECLALLEK